MRTSFLFAVLAGILSLAFSGCVYIPIEFPQPPAVQQIVYERGSGWSPDKIAIIDVSGILTAGDMGEGLFERDSSVVDFAKKLKIAKQDHKIKAVILRVDSPGGGVTASDIMYNELAKFRKERKIPVYVSMQSLAASGGYYVSMGADKIYSTPTGLTGSIGVIGTFPEARGLMDKIGVDINAIKTGPNKDAGAFYRNMTDDEKELYQSIIDDYFAQFLAVVAKNRTNMTEDQIRTAADGRVYTAYQAEQLGLIDGVAYLDEVIEIVKKDTGLDDPSVVIIKRTGHTSADTVYATQTPQTPEVNLLKLDARSFFEPTNEVFNYLWVP